MTESERLIYLRLAWFPPDTQMLGNVCRPLSLFTNEGMKLMGLTLLERGVELSPVDEYSQLLVYRWLHSESKADISEGLWSGGWREILKAVDPAEDPPLKLLNEWRTERERILSLLEASAVKVRPRKRNDKDDTPSDVVGPDEIAHRLSVVQRATGLSDDEIGWEMPLYQFNQKYHAEMRWQSFWTVRPKGEAPPADFDGFGDAVLANLKEQEGG